MVECELMAINGFLGDLNMRKYVLAMLFTMAFAFVGTNVNAQENTSKDETKTERRIYMPTGISSVDGPRFEVVIPRNNDTPYLRLDKETGEVWQLKMNLGAKNSVKAIAHEPSEFDIRKEGQNNYQIVAETSYHIYLMNLNSGLIWEYSESIFSGKSVMFQLMEVK